MIPPKSTAPATVGIDEEAPGPASCGRGEGSGQARSLPDTPSIQAHFLCQPAHFCATSYGRIHGCETSPGAACGPVRGAEASQRWRFALVTKMRWSRLNSEELTFLP